MCIDRAASEFIEGDEFSASCRISFVLEEEEEDVIDGPGRYAITWCRCVIFGKRAGARLIMRTKGSSKTGTMVLNP